MKVLAKYYSSNGTFPESNYNICVKTNQPSLIHHLLVS